MAASLRNFTLSTSEHFELSVFTATCIGSAEPSVHVPKWTTPNSPDPSFCDTLKANQLNSTGDDQMHHDCFRCSFFVPMEYYPSGYFSQNQVKFLFQIKAKAFFALK